MTPKGRPIRTARPDPSARPVTRKLVQCMYVQVHLDCVHVVVYRRDAGGFSSNRMYRSITRASLERVVRAARAVV